MFHFDGMELLFKFNLPGYVVMKYCFIGSLSVFYPYELFIALKKINQLNTSFFHIFSHEKVYSNYTYFTEVYMPVLSLL